VPDRQVEEPWAKCIARHAPLLHMVHNQTHAEGVTARSNILPHLTHLTRRCEPGAASAASLPQYGQRT
jgi:hypothetical protein